MTHQRVIKASVHILGSVSGYSTLRASPDLSPQDIQTLEVLGFGQTDDRAYLASLKDTPAAFGRPLPSGRYALTRCFVGRADSAGRQTLLFATLVFSRHDWSGYVCHSCWDMLLDPGNWVFREGDSATSTDVRLPPPDGRPADREFVVRAIQSWITARRTSSVVSIPDSLASRRAIANLAAFLPATDRPSLRWGVGVLSQSAAIDIATFPAFAEASGRRRVVRAESTSLKLEGYAAALAQFWTAQMPPADFINGASNVDQFALHANQDKAPDAVQAERSRRSLRLPIIVGGALAFALVVLAIAVATRKSAQTPASAPPEAIPTAAPVPESEAAPETAREPAAAQPAENAAPVPTPTSEAPDVRLRFLLSRQFLLYRHARTLPHDPPKPRPADLPRQVVLPRPTEAVQVAPKPPPENAPVAMESTAQVPVDPVLGDLRTAWDEIVRVNAENAGRSAPDPALQELPTLRSWRTSFVKARYEGSSEAKQVAGECKEVFERMFVAQCVSHTKRLSRQHAKLKREWEASSEDEKRVLRSQIGSLYDDARTTYEVWDGVKDWECPELRKMRDDIAGWWNLQKNRQ